MKICLFNGGLGNQAFQYIFARYMEIATGEICYLDDSHFFNLEEMREKEKETGIISTHNGYELEKVFPIAKPHLLSRYFTPDVWEHMINMKKQGISIPQQMLDLGIDIVMVIESGAPEFTGRGARVPVNEYYPAILDLKSENIYYQGYWIAKGWLWENKEQMKYELQFSEITNKKNIKYQEQIQGTNSVGVHIRRGDFLTLGWDVADVYYETTVGAIDKNFKGNCTFFVFSDDLEWCRNNACNLGLDLGRGRVVYVEGNYDRENNYIDMQLMSMCKHVIASNSSFSYLSALLNENENKIAISPSKREI